MTATVQVIVRRSVIQDPIVDLSQYLGHILVETAKTFSLFLNLQTPVELSNESNYGFDYDYKILQCS